MVEVVVSTTATGHSERLLGVGSDPNPASSRHDYKVIALAVPHLFQIYHTQLHNGEAVTVCKSQVKVESNSGAGEIE
jgi:hypothetical protein